MEKQKINSMISASFLLNLFYIIFACSMELSIECNPHFRFICFIRRRSTLIDAAGNNVAVHVIFQSTASKCEKDFWYMCEPFYTSSRPGTYYPFQLDASLTRAKVLQLANATAERCEIRLKTSVRAPRRNSISSYAMSYLHI